VAWRGGGEEKYKYKPAYEDGTGSEFRNVGNYNSDAGELPKRNKLHLEHGESLKTRTNINKFWQVNLK